MPTNTSSEIGNSYLGNILECSRHIHQLFYHASHDTPPPHPSDLRIRQTRNYMVIKIQGYRNSLRLTVFHSHGALECRNGQVGRIYRHFNISHGGRVYLSNSKARSFARVDAPIPATNKVVLVLLMSVYGFQRKFRDVIKSYACLIFVSQYLCLTIFSYLLDN